MKILFQKKRKGAGGKDKKIGPFFLESSWLWCNEGYKKVSNFPVHNFLQTSSLKKGGGEVQMLKNFPKIISNNNMEIHNRCTKASWDDYIKDLQPQILKSI